MRYWFAVLLGGCGLRPTAYTTPPSNAFEMKPYGYEIEYELLGPAGAEACATDEELKHIRSYRSPDPRTIGHGVLFERAKYEAIESVHADGLVELRAKVTEKGDGECVHVSGRAYRLQSIRATAGHEGGDRSAFHPSGESNVKRRPVVEPLP